VGDLFPQQGLPDEALDAIAAAATKALADPGARFGFRGQLRYVLSSIRPLGKEPRARDVRKEWHALGRGRASAPAGPICCVVPVNAGYRSAAGAGTLTLEFVLYAMRPGDAAHCREACAALAARSWIDYVAGLNDPDGWDARAGVLPPFPTPEGTYLQVQVRISEKGAEAERIHYPRQDPILKYWRCSQWHLGHMEYR
jgi:hypothetical protein